MKWKTEGKHEKADPVIPFWFCCYLSKSDESITPRTITPASAVTTVGVGAGVGVEVDLCVVVASV